MKRFFVLLQAVSSLKVELVRICLLYTSLNILISMHKVTLMEKLLGDQHFYTLKYWAFAFATLFSEEPDENRLEETPRAQTPLLSGLET